MARKPFQHVIKNFSDVIASEALTLHLLIIVHLTLTNFTIIELVPLGRLICRTINHITSFTQISTTNLQLKLCSNYMCDNLYLSFHLARNYNRQIKKWLNEDISNECSYVLIQKGCKKRMTKANLKLKFRTDKINRPTTSVFYEIWKYSLYLWNIQICIAQHSS